jgi:hypothetical protein
MSSTSLPRRRKRRRLRLTAPAVLLTLLMALGAACTADDPGGLPGTGTEDTAVDSDDPLSFTAYVDPNVPIVAAIGERFAFMLDAEPSEGYRWEVVVQGDPAVVLPLGSQFVDRESVTVPTTTTAAPPPPEAPAEEGEPGAAQGPTDTTDATDPTDESAPDTDADTTLPTTTTVPTRALQVISYVGRGFGTTAVQLRYVRVGQPVTDATPVVTFTIEVPLPPELLPPPPPDAEDNVDGPA